MHRSPLQWLARTLPHWLQRQVVDPRAREVGAWLDPDTGLPNSGHVGTGALLTGCVWLARWGAPAKRDFHWRRALLAARHLRRAQRSSGLIDLPSCNWDSAPDTAFLVQLLCAVLERIDPAASDVSADLDRELRAFVRRAVPGLARGGFHTPNHRWVIASALAWTATLTGDRRGDKALHAYLAEGADQDVDGAYQERSPAVYDAVTNRSLLLLDRHARWESARAAVARNLALARTLLNADGTIESLQSRRQDRSWNIVPASLAAPAWDAGEPDLAAWLWRQCERPTLNDAIWLVFALTENARAPRTLPRAAEPRPWRGAIHCPALSLARARRGMWTASAFLGRPELMRLAAPNLGLRAVSVALPYFGVGQCLARGIHARGATLTLSLGGLPHPRRPGYELPLGRPVPVERWESSLEERPLRKLPAIRGTLSATLTRDGATLRLRTQGGLPGLPAQLALDFEPGLEIRTKRSWKRLRPGEIVFLEAAEILQLRRGGRVWELGPGASAHRINPMRDAWRPSEMARIVVALRHPASHRLSLRPR